MCVCVCVCVCVYSGASQVVLVVKNPPANIGNVKRCGFYPRLGKIPGGHSNPLQNSCLRNSWNRGAWLATVRRAAKSQTRLNWHTCTQAYIYIYNNYGAISHMETSVTNPHIPIIQLQQLDQHSLSSLLRPPILFFFFGCTVCLVGSLVPWLGIEPWSMALKACVLTTGLPENPSHLFLPIFWSISQAL